MPCSFQLLHMACTRLGHDVMDVLSEHFSSVQLFKLPPFTVAKLMCAQKRTAAKELSQGGGLSCRACYLASLCSHMLRSSIWRCATYKLVATLS